MAIESIFNNIRTPQKVYNWEVDFFSSQPTGDNQFIKYYAKNVALPLQSVDYVKRYFSGSKYHVTMKDNSPSILNVTMWDNESMNMYAFFLTWFYMINRTEIDFSIIGALSGIVAGSLSAANPLNTLIAASQPSYAGKLGYLYDKASPFSIAKSGLNGGIKEKGAVPRDFLLNCNITMFDDANNARTIHKFRNCFVAEVGEINLNYNESADATFDIKLVYDKYEMERL